MYWALSLIQRFKISPFFNIIKGMLGHLSLGTVLVETGPRQFLYQCSQSRPTMLLGLDVNQLHQNKEVERFASSDIVLD